MCYKCGACMLLVLLLVVVGRCRQSPVGSGADIPYVPVLWLYRGGWCLVHEGSILAATLLLAFPCSDLAIVCGDTVRRGSSRKRL